MTKVLLVDDEPNIVMSLEYLLRRKGYAVFIARNGTEALELLGRETPDVAVLDIMMPAGAGYAICRHIKSTPELNKVKVIFLSARSRQSDIEKGYAVGADIYMTKPFSNRDLLANIEQFKT